jgi:hypothetical protein
LETVDDLCLVFWAGQDADCSVLNRDYWLLHIVGCELAARTIYSSSWRMFYDFRFTGSSEFTDGNKLVDVVAATYDRDGKLIQEQE